MTVPHGLLSHMIVTHLCHLHDTHTCMTHTPGAPVEFVMLFPVGAAGDVDEFVLFSGVDVLFEAFTLPDCPRLVGTRGMR